MNRLTIDLHALWANIRQVDEWVASHGATWTLVTKSMCGEESVLKALHAMGVRSMADSRLTNLAAIDTLGPEQEAWYLRLPHLPAIPTIVELTDVSLNSEIEVIEALSAEAKRQDKIHRVVVMIELGDLREGVLPGSLVDFYQHVFELPNIEVLGIGSNLGCLSGAIPSVDQLAQLCLYHELLELKFQRPLPMITAGTSAVLPMLRDKALPKKVNHFRIGEAVFLGSDLVNGGTLLGLRDDAITLEADVVEVQEKSLVSPVETGEVAPFEAFDQPEFTPGQRGVRAVVTIGQLDTEIRGLTPLVAEYSVVGASSDLSVVNLGDNPHGVKVGDSLKFRPSYAALVRLMLDKYVDKVLLPPLDQFRKEVADDPDDFELPPVVDDAMEANLAQERSL